MNPATFVSDVMTEYIKARKNFNAFHSPHEGYAVLLEEVDEVWEEVKHRTTYANFYSELVQVAAMAMAMALEGA